MRDAPLNVGMMIDTEGVSMGHPPIHFDGSSFTSIDWRKMTAAHQHHAELNPCAAPLLVAMRAWKWRHVIATLDSSSRLGLFLVLAAAQQVLRQRDEALNITLQLAPIFQ